MTTNKPLIFIVVLLLAIGALFFIKNQKIAQDRQYELVKKIKELKKTNDELHEQIDILQDEIDACQHDLQDCYRSYKDRGIYPTTIGNE